MSTAKKGNDDFELSADELAKQEGCGRPTLVKKEKPAEPDPPEEEPSEGDLAAQRLPGMELPAPPKLTSKQHAQLTWFAQRYDKVKYSRVELSNQETVAKKELEAYLNSVGLESFVYPGPDGKVMEVFVEKNEVIKTRERKDAPELTEPAEAGEEEPDDE
jgi:hypothetical protein